MRKLIIIFTILMACIFAVYPPFESKAKRPEQVESIQVNETIILQNENTNDRKVYALYQNLSIIDSLEKIHP